MLDLKIPIIFLKIYEIIMNYSDLNIFFLNLIMFALIYIYIPELNTYNSWEY